MYFQTLFVILVSAALASADFGFGNHNHNNNNHNGVIGRQARRFTGTSISGATIRQGRQFDGQQAVPGGIDFSGCQTDPETGLCCIEKEPILECTHKNVEKCHYTYVTQFEPAQEEVCEENFEKTCQITFKQQAFNETVQKCYRPLQKVCNGQGPEECRTVYESSCTTKYVEKQPGKFVGDTSCEKLPVEICGAGCVTEEGEEECHEKTVATLVDVPEEVCDLNPQKTCRFQTKLVPRLKPEHECTIIPQETCNLRFSNPNTVDKPLLTKWCLDPTPPTPDETYDDANALGDVLRTSGSAPQATYVQPPRFSPQQDSFSSVPASNQYTPQQF